MTAAEDSFRQGNLSDCLQALQSEVRRRPDDVRQRIFLVQVLMLLGQWERALTQLGVVQEMDAGALPMVHSYGAAIQCEHLRAAVFRGERSPLLFGEPEPWIAQMIQALGLHAGGHIDEAAAMRARALEEAPTTPGTLNGTAFQWLMDGDSRLGPMLEVHLQGGYYWIPLHRVRQIRIEPPEDVRDFVWIPAQFMWANGGEANGLIPTRYPGSELSEDNQLRLARKTDWIAAGENSASGLGQRMLFTDAAEYPLLEVRSIQLEAPPV